MKSKFRPTQDYAKDTGLVIVLILLLTAYWTEKLFFLPLSIGTLLVVMTVPVVLKPLAVIWYYFSTGLGNMTNRIVLTVIFVGVLILPEVVYLCVLIVLLRGRYFYRFEFSPKPTVELGN